MNLSSKEMATIQYRKDITALKEENEKLREFSGRLITANVVLNKENDTLKEQFEEEVKKSLVESMSVETFKEIKRLKEENETLAQFTLDDELLAFKTLNDRQCDLLSAIRDSVFEDGDKVQERLGITRYNRDTTDLPHEIRQRLLECLDEIDERKREYDAAVEDLKGTRLECELAQEIADEESVENDKMVEEIVNFRTEITNLGYRLGAKDSEIEKLRDYSGCQPPPQMK